MATHFKSEADVQAHFDVQRKLAQCPAVPLDLWQRMQVVALRTAEIPQRKPVPLSLPDLRSMRFSEIPFLMKKYPIHAIERLNAAPDVRFRMPKTHRLNRSG
jgi:hypothetical protein